MPRALRQNFLQKIVVVRRKSSPNLPGKELEHRHRAHAVADQAMQQLRVNSMTQLILSSPAPGSKGESKSVKVSRSPEGRRDRRNKWRRDARPKKALESTSNATLLARSKEFMKNLLEEFDMRPSNGDDLFGAVLNAKLGKKFYHKKRSDQRKALAASTLQIIASSGECGLSPFVVYRL